MADKKILLVEPAYRNKYPPLGLMKIAQYHGPRGKRDQVRFIKGEDRSVLGPAWDRIYVTTLFSFEFPRIAQSIDFALSIANGHADRVFDIQTSNYCPGIVRGFFRGIAAGANMTELLYRYASCGDAPLPVGRTCERGQPSHRLCGARFHRAVPSPPSRRWRYVNARRILGDMSGWACRVRH